jgi:hypothetical protein
MADNKRCVIGLQRIQGCRKKKRTMNNLLQYVEAVLRPPLTQISDIPSKIKRISNIIKNNMDLSLKMIIPGGSYEKGTLLKYKPDIDLVLVFNEEPGINWKELRKKVYKKLLQAFPNNDIKLGDQIAIHLKFNDQNGQNSIVNFDIVPSYYANLPLQMTSSKNSKIYQYQGITSIGHIEYWEQNKSIPLIVETVMLLKDWKNEQEIKLKSFHMELIAASAYEYRLEEENNLDKFLISCFQDIQGMIDGVPIFPVNWKYFDKNSINDHYDFSVLIDPANPKENLLRDLSNEDAKKIKSKATKAIANIKIENYGKIFDPKNKTNFFA